jgi:O-antigen/teichoic acid export membrane protein
MIVRAVTAQLLSNAVAGGTSFLFTMWVARVTGPGQFAEYSFYFSVGSVVAILMDGGYHSVLLRERARTFNTIGNEPTRLAGAASGHALTVLVVALGTTWLFYRDHAAGLSASLCYFFFLIQGQFVSQALRGGGRFLVESVWAVTQRAIAIAIPILYFYFFRRDTNPIALMALGAAGLAIPVLALHRRLGVSGLDRPRWKFGLGLVALPFLLIDLGTTVNFRADVFILTLLKSDPPEAGRYLAAARIYEAMVYLAAGPLFVVIVRLRKRSDHESKAFLRSIGAGVAIALIVAVACGLMAPWLLQSFAGASYGESADYLRILLCGLVFQYPAVLMLAVGISGERPWRYAAIVGAAACFNLVLCRWLVYHQGVVGAAYSNVITQLLLAFALGISLISVAISKRHVLAPR